MFFQTIVLNLILAILFYPASLLAGEDEVLDVDSYSALESSLPSAIASESVQCRSEGIELIGNTKLKRCPNVTWRGKAERYKKTVNLFYWRNILITSYDDNKRVRVSFDQQRAGFSSDTEYYIYAHLFDVHYALLKTVEVTDDHGMISCNDPKREEWHHYSYEGKLTGDDEFKYEDIAHIVYTLKVSKHDKWLGCNI